MVCTVSCDARHLNLTRAEGVQITFLSVASAYLASGESVVLPDDDTGTKAPRVVFNANGLGTVDLAPGTYQAVPRHPQTGTVYPPFYITVDNSPAADLIDLMGLSVAPAPEEPHGNPAITYATVQAMIADRARLRDLVSDGSRLMVFVRGGRSEGDGGAAHLAIRLTTGGESTVSQNGLAVAPGFEIIMDNGIKAIWPTRVVNAITMGMRPVETSTVAESIAANDAFLHRLNAMADNHCTLHIPAGTYWHKEQSATVQDRTAFWIRGAGIDATIINQADWTDANGNPQYDDGSGLAPNPLIQSSALFQLRGGSYGGMEGFTYNCRWMRIRGLWIRNWGGTIRNVKVTESCGRAIAASNANGVEWDTLNPAYGRMTLDRCFVYRSIGTALSNFGNTGGRVTNCRVETCWAEACCPDASSDFIVEGNTFIDCCRMDDQAGFPPAGLWNQIAGNGGVAVISPGAKADNVIIRGNILIGCAQDDPASPTRSKPFIRWRPRNGDVAGLVVADNIFQNGFIGIHIPGYYTNGAGPPYDGLHKCVNFTITGNVFRGILTNAGQGHICIGQNARDGRIEGNESATTFLKVFTSTNGSPGNPDGSYVNNRNALHDSIFVQTPVITFVRVKSDNEGDPAEQLNVTGNGTLVKVTYPTLRAHAKNPMDYATGTLTCAYEGHYTVTASCEINSMTGATSAVIELRIDGTARARRKYAFPGTAEEACLEVTASHYLNVGDTIEVFVSATGIGADTADLWARPLGSRLDVALVAG